MKRLILFIVCLGFSMSVQARLGETYDQCVSRYGNPSKKDGDRFTFYSGVFRLDIFFYAERAITIMYSKPGEFIRDQILKTEIIAILDANSSGQSWSDYKVPEKYRDQHILNSLWRRGDGSLACYKTMECILFITEPRGISAILKDGDDTTRGL